MRVVERPVAMNKAENRAAVLLMKKPMVIGEPIAVLGNFLDEGIALLVVVVKV